MSHFIVCCLNAYRKPSCTTGRITSNEDFKYLARKVLCKKIIIYQSFIKTFRSRKKNDILMTFNSFNLHLHFIFHILMVIRFFLNLLTSK